MFFRIVPGDEHPCRDLSADLRHRAAGGKRREWGQGGGYSLKKPDVTLPGKEEYSMGFPVVRTAPGMPYLPDNLF